MGPGSRLVCEVALSYDIGNECRLEAFNWEGHGEGWGKPTRTQVSWRQGFEVEIP